MDQRHFVISFWCTVAMASACGTQPTEVVVVDEPAAATDGTNPASAQADGGTTAPPPDPAAPGGPQAPTGGGPTDDKIKDPLGGLPTGGEQLKTLCARGNQDNVSTAFCAGAPPSIKSLADLQGLFGLTPDKANFALTGHSSSLVTRSTSAINPRAIFFPKNNNAKDFVAMGFVRGEPFVELVARDPTTAGGTPNLRFFLFKFEPACTSAPGGCTAGDLLTPSVESNHTGNYTLYQDEDIKNTVLDCKQCHQAGGVQTPKMLRMQERKIPWAHFFGGGTGNGGSALLSDFQAAHDKDESYANIPGNKIQNSNPYAMEAFVEGQGFKNQPNEFDSGKIANEVRQANRNQPQSNTPAGTSTTWDKLFQASLKGEQIPPPYHDIKVTDPTKLASATAAYRAVVSGAAPAASMPDIRDVFLDSGAADMSFKPAPGQSGEAILAQMCGQCHNSRLDQTLSRAKFNALSLSTMSAEEKALAIARMNLPADSARKMPPPRFKELSAADIASATAALK